MKYEIPQLLIESCKLNENNSFMEPRVLKMNEIALFNKNKLNFQYFINYQKALNFYGYIGEADNLDSYFSKVVKKI